MNVEPVPSAPGAIVGGPGERPARKRPPRVRIWHVLFWLVGLTLVLAYARGAKRQPELVAILVGVYVLATLLGLWTSRTLQRLLLVLIAVLPLASVGVLFSSRFLYKRPQTLAETVALIATLVVGVPSWLALVVTLVIRGLQQPRNRRVRPIFGVLLLTATWGAALGLLYAAAILFPGLFPD